MSQAKPKILVSDSLSDEGLAILREGNVFDVLVETGLPTDVLKKRLQEVDGVVVRSGTTLTKELLDGNTSLKIIGRAGIGVDNVDVDTATRQGIVVMNTPGGNATTTAEHTLALIFSLARHIPQAYSKLKGGKWDRKTFIGTELTDKTLGLVGIGNIGALVAERAQGLKMRVVAYDPFVTKEHAAKLGVELLDLASVIKKADILSVHVPLNDKTRNLIGEVQLKTMKKTAFVINCARGGIVDELALDKALREGVIAGAALDVFEEEPPKSDHPLLSNEKVIYTPHLGASTTEAQAKVAVDVAYQMRDFFLKGEIRNAVNTPSLSQETLERLGPYLQLSGQLGTFVAQVHRDPVEKISIRLDGDLANQDSKPLVAKIVRGILAMAVEEPINEINAVGIASARGIEVETVKSPQVNDFASSLQVRLEGGKQVTQVTGTVFGKQDPRIVRINDYLVDALRPVGTLLLVTNNDVPGVIGAIGTTCGKQNVNIAQMSVGRTGLPGGKALTVVTLDGPATQKLIDQLTDIPQILSVQQVQL